MPESLRTTNKCTCIWIRYPAGLTIFGASANPIFNDTFRRTFRRWWGVIALSVLINASISLAYLFWCNALPVLVNLSLSCTCLGSLILWCNALSILVNFSLSCTCLFGSLRRQQTPLALDTEVIFAVNRMCARGITITTAAHTRIG